MTMTMPALSLRSGYEIHVLSFGPPAYGTSTYSPWRGEASSDAFACSAAGGRDGSRGAGEGDAAWVRTAEARSTTANMSGSSFGDSSPRAPAGTGPAASGLRLGLAAHRRQRLSDRRDPVGLRRLAL